jgi:hypothetical protein
LYRDKEVVGVFCAFFIAPLQLVCIATWAWEYYGIPKLLTVVQLAVLIRRNEIQYNCGWGKNAIDSSMLPFYYNTG